MDADRLVKLGFTLMVGQVDRNGKNYGFFNRHGVFLTPEGEDLVARLEADDDPARPAQVELPVPRKAPRKKAEAPETAADVVESVGQALLDLND